MSIEYYQPHLCKHILSEVDLAKSHMPPSFVNLYGAHIH